MRIIELEDVAREASRTERAARVLDRFRERVSGAEDAHEVSMMRSMELVAGGAAWKMKLRGNGHRLIFTMETTPGGNPFVIAHHLLPHDEYDRLDHSGAFGNLRGVDPLGLPGVLEIVADLDSGPAPPNGSARRPSGLPFSLDISATEGQHIVQETADWVDNVLLPLVESSDGSGAVTLARGIIDAPNQSHELVFEDTEVLRMDDSTLVCRPEGQSPPIVRRTFPMPQGLEAVDDLVRIHEAAAAHIDPFLELHGTQVEILNRFRHRPFESLPAVFDGPGGSGKTAVLLLLVKGIIRHRGGTTEGIESITVHMVTASPRLARDLQRNVSNHLQLVERWEVVAADETAAEVCLTLDDYFLSWLDTETRRRFNDSRSKITWPRFREWYEKRAWHDGRAHEAWCALRAVIDGDREGRDDPPGGEETEEFENHIRHWFAMLPERRRQGLSDDAMVMALGVRRRYVEWKSSENLWDEADLVDAFLEALDAGGQTRRLVDLVVIDEAQDLTPDMIRGIVRTSSFFASDSRAIGNDADSRLPLPFVFAADDLQTINPSGFSWTGFRALFFEETGRMLGGTSRGLRISPETLSVNFRMRENVYDVALSLRRWMNPGSGGSGEDALRPLGFSGPVRAMRTAEVCRALLASASRILIPDWSEVSPEETVLLEATLGPRREPGSRQQNPRWGKILTATEAKGQEFRSAVLLGFGNYVRRACPERSWWKSAETSDRSTLLALRYAQQVTYVAASRVRDVAVWLDLDESAEEWFWDGVDSRSPGAILDPKRHFDHDVLEEMRETASEKARDGRTALETALRNLDLDRNDRAAAARAAAAAFAEAEEPLLQWTAEAIAQYLDPLDGEESLRLVDIPERYRLDLMDEVCRDGSWFAFDGPMDASSDADLIGGAVVLALREGNGARAVSMLNLMTSTSRVGHAKIVEALSDAWDRVVEYLADDVVSAAPSSPVPVAAAIEFLEKMPGAEGGVIAGLVEARDGDLLTALKGLARVPGGMRKVRENLSWRVLSRHSGVTWVPRESFPRVAVTPTMNRAEMNVALAEATDALFRSEEFQEKVASLEPAMFDAMPVIMRSRVLAEHLNELAQSLLEHED